MPVFEDLNQVQEIVRQGFYGKYVLVVGDLILDRYLWGDVTRISPESPVPVVQLVRENEVGGGAANVAINLARLGLRVAVSGFVGQDANRDKLLEILKQEKIDADSVVTLQGWTTITKTRVISGHQQMIRIDREKGLSLSEKDTEFLVAGITGRFQDGVAAVIFSDYAKGCLTEAVCQEILTAARIAGIPVFVDPKGDDYRKYRGATAISPNRLELSSVCRVPHQDLDQLLEAGKKLAADLELDFMAVTLSGQGIALLEGEKLYRIPAAAKEVFDVSGAGDTVIAVLAASLAAGLSRLDALHLANLAAGVVVGRVGTAPVYKGDLLKSLSAEQALEQSEKICSIEVLAARVEEWRARGERIVFTNGCFDLLHAGHVTYLAKAKHLGGRLLVGLNTDRSVKALKGENRPVINQEDRARVLASLAAVDAVVLFDEDTPLQLIRVLRPEVLAKGADYAEDQVVGGEEVKAWGGEVALIELVDGKSSSMIVESLQKKRS